MRRRIIVLTNSVGGLHSFRKEVMEALIDAGFEVFISVPDEDDRAIYFESIGCHIIKTEFNRRGMNPFADFGLMLKYRRILLQLKPMAVLSYTVKPNVYGGIACRLCGVPQLANVTGLGDAIENGGWLQRITVILYRIGIGKAQRVFFQNQSNREQCIKLGIADNNSILLPGSGVNLNYHSLQPYPVDEGKVRFLYIGRLMKDKGVEEFFETARYVRGKYANSEFWVLGTVEGDYQAELNELTKGRIIHYLGTTSDVRPFIGKVECTVMPSYHEGMSNVNLESSANGRPVITTKVPGCKETVDDGKTGFLVEAHSAKSLIDAVERFIELSYAQRVSMGREARQKVEREFDRKIVVNAYLKEIKRISNV